LFYILNHGQYPYKWMRTYGGDEFLKPKAHKKFQRRKPTTYYYLVACRSRAHRVSGKPCARTADSETRPPPDLQPPPLRVGRQLLQRPAVAPLQRSGGGGLSLSLCNGPPWIINGARVRVRSCDGCCIGRAQRLRCPLFRPELSRLCTAGRRLPFRRQPIFRRGRPRVTARPRPGSMRAQGPGPGPRETAAPPQIERASEREKEGGREGGRKGKR
jgi:hypothetical protein